jgi:hypothetical protein
MTTTIKRLTQASNILEFTHPKTSGRFLQVRVESSSSDLDYGLNIPYTTNFDGGKLVIYSRDNTNSAWDVEKIVVNNVVVDLEITEVKVIQNINFSRNTYFKIELQNSTLNSEVLLRVSFE